jgi:hypothetical protein
MVNSDPIFMNDKELITETVKILKDYENAIQTIIVHSLALLNHALSKINLNGFLNSLYGSFLALVCFWIIASNKRHKSTIIHAIAKIGHGYAIEIGGFIDTLGIGRPRATKRIIIPPDFKNLKLENNYFMPRFVKVLKGQEVEWVNLDTSSHQLRFYGVLDNDLERIEPKESASKRFDYDQSRIDYRCTLHNNEFGTVVIYPKPEEQMTNKEQFEFLSKIFDIKPPPSLSHLVSK